MSSTYEYRISHDKNFLNDDELARVQYRREGDRNWRSFVVVLDDETTYETVAQNVEQIIALYSGTSVPAGAPSDEGDDAA